MKIGKSDLIDIGRIDQSIEIDDTLLSFIDLSRFYRFHRFYRKIHLFFCSVLSTNEKWFHANSEFVDNGIAIESRRIKQFISTFKKKSLKKSYLFFKTRFEVFFWRPILARGRFLESPGNFSGPKSNILIEKQRIRVRILASKVLHFVSITDSFIMLDTKLLRPLSCM